MAKDFEINSSRLQALFAASPIAAAKGAKTGLHDALDDWVVQAKDIAPIDKGTLRRGITPEGIEGNGLDLKATIQSTAIEDGFNYAYYIHELDAGGKNVGGEHRYLDVSAEENQEKWVGWVEKEVEAELKKAGW